MNYLIEKEEKKRKSFFHIYTSIDIDNKCNTFNYS